MARNVLVDAGFVVALLSRRDAHHQWAAEQVPQLAPPWSTCEAALSEAFHLIGARGAPSLSAFALERIENLFDRVSMAQFLCRLSWLPETYLESDPYESRGLVASR